MPAAFAILQVMQKSEVRIDPLRLRAAAILRFGKVDALHRRLPVCGRAVWERVARGAVRGELAEAMARELGPDAWAFVTGASNTLTDERRAA